MNGHQSAKDKFLCFWGLHKWEVKEENYLGNRQVVYNRCKRPGCTHYGHWVPIGIERRLPW